MTQHMHGGLTGMVRLEFQCAREFQCGRNGISTQQRGKGETAEAGRAHLRKAVVCPTGKSGLYPVSRVFQ